MKKSDKFVVTGHATYVPAQSDIETEKFVWSYEVKIENQSDEVVQLLNRRWRIIDMTGKIEEIQGVGVIGMQPLIKPGKTFTYSSYCQLMTPQGTMGGEYEMQNLEEEHFLIEIPRFILSAPASVTKGYKSILH